MCAEMTYVDINQGFKSQKSHHVYLGTDGNLNFGSSTFVASRYDKNVFIPQHGGIIIPQVLCPGRPLALDNNYVQVQIGLNNLVKRYELE